MKGATCDGRNNPHPTFEFDKRKATKPVLSKNKPLPTQHIGGGNASRTPSKRSRRGGACVPARTFAQRRFHTKNTRIVCGEFNGGCALAGRHGRAHRHRPYQTPLYFSTQSYTNKRTIYAQPTPTAPTIPHTIYPNDTNCPRAIYPNEIVGAVPACPPERPRAGVSIRMFSYTKLLFTSYKICLHATVEDYQKYNFVSFHTPVHYGQHDPNSYAATTAHRKALNCAASHVLYMRWLSSF